MINEFVNQVFDQQFVEEFGPESLEKLSPTELVLTKEQDGQLVGVLQAVKTLETIHVKALVVAKEAQGLGLGSQLLSELEEQARELEVTSITLSTKSYQAKDFYLKNGYELYASLEDVPLKGVIKYHFIRRIGKG
ncbi:GNAT family N-acetyltransferase [Streptococcus sp. ZY1909104]|uniref:GNAT family N-acetyltransferase n=1 Tax=Streptococcus sp. ZY1909104 TaxID=3233335 RepID=UPI00349F2DCD